MLICCDLWPKEFKIEQQTGLLFVTLRYVCSSKANSYYGQQLTTAIHGPLWLNRTTTYNLLLCYCSSTKNQFLSSLLLLLLLISVFESSRKFGFMDRYLEYQILRINDIGFVKLSYLQCICTPITYPVFGFLCIRLWADSIQCCQEQG